MNLGQAVRPRPMLILSEMKSEMLQKNVSVRTLILPGDMELLGRRNHVGPARIRESSVEDLNVGGNGVY
jgi:hypothetical protein